MTISLECNFIVLRFQCLSDSKKTSCPKRLASFTDMEFQLAANKLTSNEFEVFWHKLLVVFGNKACTQILCEYFSSLQYIRDHRLLAMDVINNIIHSRPEQNPVNVRKYKQRNSVHDAMNYEETKGNVDVEYKDKDELDHDDSDDNKSSDESDDWADDGKGKRKKIKRRKEKKRTKMKKSRLKKEKRKKDKKMRKSENSKRRKTLSNKWFKKKENNEENNAEEGVEGVPDVMLLWLGDIGMERYYDKFKQNGYNLDILVQMKVNINDFKFLGRKAKKADKVILMNKVNELNEMIAKSYRLKMERDQRLDHQISDINMNNASAPFMNEFVAMDMEGDNNLNDEQMTWQ